MQPLASLVGSRQRRDITHFEETLRNIDEYWVAVERRYIALFCCLVGWNAWNIVYIFNCFFERACGYQFLSIWNLTHTICAMGAMAVFLKNKPLESLNRDNVHQQRCQHGLSLLNLYRDDKTKLLYHIHHEKKIRLRADIRLFIMTKKKLEKKLLSVSAGVKALFSGVKRSCI